MCCEGRVEELGGRFGVVGVVVYRFLIFFFVVDVVFLFLFLCVIGLFALFGGVWLLVLWWRSSS